MQLGQGRLGIWAQKLLCCGARHISHLSSNTQDQARMKKALPDRIGLTLPNPFRSHPTLRIPGWLSGLGPAFSPGCNPRVPGSSPASGSLHGACFSLCLCPCLSFNLCLSRINKVFKKKIEVPYLLNLIWKLKKLYNFSLCCIKYAYRNIYFSFFLKLVSEITVEKAPFIPC